MSGMQHKASVRTRFIRCMSTVAEIQANQCDKAQSILDTLEVQKFCSELAQADIFCPNKGVDIHMSLRKKNANDLLRNRSPTQKAFFSGDSLLASTSVMDKVYNVFGLEPFLNLLLGISKLLKECAFKVPASDRVMKKPGGVLEQRQPLSQMRESIQCDVNFLIAAIDRDAGVFTLHVDVSSKGFFTQLNGLILNSGVHLMHEGKDYHAVDMFFRL